MIKVLLFYLENIPIENTLSFDNIEFDVNAGNNLCSI